MRFISTFCFRVAMLAICAIASSQSAYCTINSKWYVQDGLVAHWDGIDNAGFGLHDANANAWKDLVGGYEFVLSNAIITENGVSFAGTAKSFGTLDATGTAATFNIAKNGTLEIVYAKNSANFNQVILQSTATSGIAYGIYNDINIIAYTGSGNKSALFSFASGVNTNIVSVKYSSAVPSAIIANGKLITQSGSNYWGSPNSTTVIGTRTSKSANHFNGTIFAIRLYKHQLSDEEAAYNAALDRVRYLGGTLADELPETLPSKYRYNSESGTIECAHTIDFDASKGSVTVDSTVYSERAQLWSPIGISTNITLTATPAAGCELLHWEGMVPDSDKLNNPLTLTIKDAPHSVTAVFAKIARVAPDATGNSTGADWENAFTNIQEAIDACGDTGTLKIKSGTYIISNELTVASGSDLRFIGGYTGNGDERGEGYSVLARDSSVTSMRIVYIKDSNVIMDGLVVSNGLLRGGQDSSHYGLGVRAENSTLMITNCIITKNSDKRDRHRYYGGGLQQSGGTLTIVDSIFDNNVLASATDYSKAYGGAIYAVNVKSDIRNSKFINNQVANSYIDCQGGALWFSGGSSTIRNCVFDKNSVKKSDNYSGRDNGFGGCIYANGLSTFVVEDCIFTGNFNNSRISSGYTYGARGGTFYLEGSSMKTAINRCAFYGNGSRASSTTLDSGSIYLRSGTLGMTNVLQAACKYGDGIEVLGGTLNILNCTIASITNGYAIRQSGSGAKISVKNSILEGGKGVYLVSAGTAQSFNNCLTSHELPAGVGVGNVVGNALFGDSVYFHPRSQAGRYDGGWFTGGSWIQDEDDCPSIDMGDKASPVGDELQPNRHTVNIGYDGSMAVASKSYLGTPAVPTSLAAYLYPLEDIAATSMTIKWETAFAVGGQATATLYWGEVDGGTDVDAWPNCRVLGTADNWQLGTAAITGLSGLSYFRVKADDGVSTAWSDVREFKPATPPKLQNVEVSHITRQTMRVVGTLADDGGVPTTVSLRYWPSGNEDAAMVMDYDLGQTVTNGTEMVFEVTGLTAGLYYEWVLEAKNAVGAVGEIKSIHTMTTAPAVFYVTPEGAGIEDGSSWDNAFSKLQDAIDVCVVPGDLICLKEGEYADFGYFDVNDRSQSVIIDIPGLTIRGGYTGNGDERGGVTILTRNLKAPTPERRHFNISNSTVVFEDLTFTNGCIKAGGFHGQSIYSSSSTLTFRNCKFIRNGYIDYAAVGSNSGGAIYASKGSLSIMNSIFDTDAVSRHADDSNTYGGALYLSTLTAVISDCVFTNCHAKSLYKAHGGGAITVVGASNILIERSTFNKCFIVRQDEANTSRDVGYGGAIQVACTDSEKTNFTMRDCVIDGSYARTNGGKGGVIHIKGSKVAVNLDSVAITRAGNESIGAVYNHGNIYLASGTLNATNLLFASTSGTNSIIVAGGTANIVNATIVDGLRGYGIRQTAGTVNVLNSILWGNKLGGTLVTGGTFNQSYCNNQDGANLANNVICEDPRFRYNEPLPYALSSGSPSIDAGAFDASHAAGERDLAGKRRYRGRIDHGCYEFSNRGFSIILR